MGKSSIFGVVLVVLAAMARPVGAGNGDKWLLQLGGTLPVLTGTYSDNYNLGFGGDASLGYCLNDQMTLSLEAGYYTLDAIFSPAPPPGWDMWGAMGYAPLLLVIKYGFGSGMFKPYLGVGGGMAFNNAWASVSTPSDGEKVTSTSIHDDVFLADARVGVEIELEPKVNLFIQVKGHFDFVSSSYSSESPFVFIVPQIGFNFLN